MRSAAAVATLSEFTRPNIGMRARASAHSSQVSLTTLDVIIGAELPPRARQLVEDHLDAIIIEWNRLNPGRPIL